MLKRLLPFVLMFLWIASAAGAIGLDFVPNVGQARDGSAFSTEIPGAHVAFRNTSFDYTFAVRSEPRRLVPARMNLVGANPRPEIAGTGLLPGIVNVHTATATFSKIPTYGGLRYESVYPGIDLEIDGVAGSLKSTWVVAPHIDPARIRWRYEGFDHVGIDAEGNLVLTLPAEKGEESRVVTETAPIAWQNVEGQRIPVEVRYRERKDGSLSFEVGVYDEDAPLVIDPTLIYNKKIYGLTLSGEGIAADAAGNTYLGGASTLGMGYVTKLDPGAVRQWTTYFGESRFVHDVALGPNNQVYVAGADGGNGFTAKLDNAGTVVYQIANGDFGTYSIAVDAQGNSYLAGADTLTKRNSAGGVVYAVSFPVRHLGAVAVDGAGNPVVAGVTFGLDVYVAALDSGGGIVRSTTFGGGNLDSPTGIAVDEDGWIYAVGHTASDNFPLVNPVDAVFADDGSCDGICREGFIVVLNGAMVQSFGTYLGGDAADSVEDVALEAGGTIHVAGWTETGNNTFPLVKNIAPLQGGGDAFVAKLPLQPSGLYSLEYSTPLGDADDDSGWSLALSGSVLYVAGQTVQAGSGDATAFVAKLHHAGLLPAGEVVNINFQPEESEVPEGFFPDSGLPFGSRGNGWSYGWVPFGSGDIPKLAAYDVDVESEQQYDTFVSLAEAEETVARWEIELKPGRYAVRLVAGSPEIPGSTAPLYWVQAYAEGVPFVSALRTPDPGQRWVEGVANVAVTDGRLTLTLDGRADGWISLAFLEIDDVTAPNAPPTVAVTSPNGGKLNSGRPVTLHAQADDRDGKIAKVDFYSTNATGKRVLLGTDATAPYSWNWGCPAYGIPCIPGVAAGKYTIDAVATDNEGLATRSAPVSIEVKALQTQRPEFKVELKIFIPYETADIPIHPLHTDEVAKGDDRDLSSTSQGFRMGQRVTLIPSAALDADGIKDGTIVNLAGQSVNYERGSSINPETGRLTLQARSEPLTEANKGVPYMTDYDTLNAEEHEWVTAEPRPNPSTSLVRFSGHASDPLVFPACYIDWSIWVEVDATNPAAPVASVYGWQNGFPAYEIYIDGQPVYQWKPPADRGVGFLCLPVEWYEEVYSGPIYLK